MEYDQFIAHVQSRGDMGSPSEAERAVRAVLSALGEHLDESEGDELASQLPQEVSDYVRGERVQHSPVLSLPAFQGRVGQLAGVKPQQATVYTAAVCRVLKDVVPPKWLPGSLKPLFSFG